MTARSTHNGVPTVYNEAAGRWELQDSSGTADCPVCGKQQTAEGYDACIGHIPGAISACCGHGAANPYVVFPDVPTLLLAVSR